MTDIEWVEIPVLQWARLHDRMRDKQRRIELLERQVAELSESLASYGLCDECRRCDAAMDPVTGERHAP